MCLCVLLHKLMTNVYEDTYASLSYSELTSV